ncbi:MAG: hypothetical protein F6K10_38385 [Moorea sp. SIO2B7]|nr:hypothetical protein [Moorena sp. SIO2B7]
MNRNYSDAIPSRYLRHAATLLKVNLVYRPKTGGSYKRAGVEGWEFLIEFHRDIPQVAESLAALQVGLLARHLFATRMACDRVA